MGRIQLGQTSVDDAPDRVERPENQDSIRGVGGGQGADVIYAAAGGTGIGVLQAAADEGILSIGVDSNQNYMHPGKVLTSMLKRVDNAVYEAFKEGEALTPGINVMGLANEGVGYAMDENNASLVTPEMQAAVDAAAEKIKSGELVVHDYMSDNTCPAGQF